MAYRIVVSGGRPSGGDVALDACVERQDGEEWVPLAHSYRTVILNGDAVLAITEGPGTDAQKRAALIALFKQSVPALQFIEADSAYSQLEALLPAGWPVTVAL
jgi:hypothetical protein